MHLIWLEMRRRRRHPGAKYGTRSAIDLGGVRNSTITNNLIYDAHAKGITLAQIRAAQGSTKNIVANKTVLVTSDGQSALRIANSSTGNSVLNNGLYSSSLAGTLTNSAASLTGLVMNYHAGSSRYWSDDGNTAPLR